MNTLQHPYINLTGIIDGQELVPDSSPFFSPYTGMPGLSNKNPREDLAYIHNQFPFVPILPLPDVITKVLVANVAQYIDIPSATVLVQFKGTGDFWLSWFDVAAIPVAGADNNAPAIGNAVYNPTGQWYYSNNVRQLSVIANMPCIVQVLAIKFQPGHHHRKHEGQ